MATSDGGDAGPEEEFQRHCVEYEAVLRDQTVGSHLLKLIQVLNTFTEENWQKQYLVYVALPKYVNIITKRSDYSNEDLGQVNGFLQGVLCLCAEWIKGHVIAPGLLEVIYKIFSPTRFSQYYSAKTYRPSDEDSDNYMYVRPAEDLEDGHPYLLNSLELFGVKGGFNSLLGILEHKDNLAPSVVVMNRVLRIFWKIREFLNVEMMEEFMVRLVPSVVARVNNLTEEDVKVTDKKTFIDLGITLESLMDSTKAENLSEIMSKFYLQFALKCYKSEYMEKRLSGLNDIRDMIGTAMRMDNSEECDPDEGLADTVGPINTSWLKPEWLAKWLTKNKVLEYLFGENMHPEIIKRAVDIPRFLALEKSLTIDHLDLIWKASVGMHESVAHVIHPFVAELTLHLPLEHINHIYTLMKAVPLENYDVQMLSLLRNFILNAINITAVAETGERLPCQETYGLEILWDLLQDHPNLSPNVAEVALLGLEELFAWPCTYPFRGFFIDKCIENVRSSRAVPMSLRVLQRILKTYPLSTKKRVETIGLVIERLQNSFSIIDLLLSDMNQFIGNGKSSMNEGGDENTMNVIVGQVKDRLDFLMFICTNSTLTLSTSQMDLLWNILVSESGSIRLQELYFGWLEELRQNVKAFDENAGLHIFRERFVELDLAALSPVGFGFFEFFFRLVNWDNWRSHHKNGHDEYIILSTEFVGIDALWKITLTAMNEEVGDNAVVFLCKLHTNYSASLFDEVLHNRKAFIGKCMKELDVGAKQVADRVSGGYLRVNRCLALLTRCLKNFETVLTSMGQSDRISRHNAMMVGEPMSVTVVIVQGPRLTVSVHCRDTLGCLRGKVAAQAGVEFSAIRIISGGRELKEDGQLLSDLKIVNGSTLHATRRPKPPAGDVGKSGDHSLESSAVKEVMESSVYPSTILSEKRYFDQLFDMLSLEEEVATKVWQLLLALPTNPDMQAAIQNVTSSSFDPASWATILPVDQPFRLMYALQIVDHYSTHLGQAEGQDSVWSSDFLKKDGVVHLVRLLMNMDVSAMGFSGRRCAALVIKMVNRFMKATLLDSKSLMGIDNRSRTSAKFIELKSQIIPPETTGPQACQTLLFLVWDVAKSPCAFGRSQEAVQDDSKVTDQAMGLVAALCIADPECLKHVCDLNVLGDWLECTLLKNFNEVSRSRVYESIVLLCNDVTSGGEGSKASVEAAMKFLGLLVKFMQSSLARYAQTCYQMFKVMSFLISYVKRANTEALPTALGMSAVDMLHLITSHLKSLSTADIANKDCLLVGYLEVLSSLVKGDSLLKTEAGQGKESLLVWLFNDALFATPGLESDDEFPLCKSPVARSSAFHALREIATDCEQNFSVIATMLLNQIKGGHDYLGWNFLPQAYEKSTTGYVGLKNLSATCYMNSLLQQLYMIPGFRYEIMQVPYNFDIEEENIVHHLKLMFSYLQCSTKKFFDTREFCSAYRDYDGEPMNPALQMDVDEFYNVIFDKLENELKKTKDDVILKNYFEGKYVNQIIGKECPHYSEREEPFYPLSLVVKNKKSVQESLELLVEGEMLSGDSKYHCSVCDAKVDALKRVCIQDLPHTLTLHLKRFEYDLDTMRKYKLNDYYEFPMTLNMEPYTKEGLARREREGMTAGGETMSSASDDWLNSADIERPASHYEYELVGVLVHTGTADSGHYYSFIKERAPLSSKGKREWIHFNDSHTELFDISELESNCFGGVESQMQWDAAQQKQVPRYFPRPNSAYMLFYERIGSSDQVDAKKREAVPEEIYRNVWEENTQFLRDKNLFDPLFCMFLWEYTHLFDNGGEENNENALMTGPSQQASPHTFEIAQLATHFVFEIASRSKDKAAFGQWGMFMKALFEVDSEARQWFLHAVVKEDWLLYSMLLCNVGEVRNAIGKLVVHVVGLMSEEEYDDNMAAGFDNDVNLSSDDEAMGPGTSIAVLLDGCVELFSYVPNYWRFSANFFAMLRDIAAIGAAERRLMLSRRFIAHVLSLYLVEESPMRSRLHGTPQSKRSKMGEKKSPIILSCIIDLLSILVHGSSRVDENQNVLPTLNPLPGSEYVLCDHDLKLLVGSNFLPRLIREGINPERSAELVSCLAYESVSSSDTIICVIMSGISNSEYDEFAPYFVVLKSLVKLEDSHREWRVKKIVFELLGVIRENREYRNATEYSIRGLQTLISCSDVTKQAMAEHREEWVDDWVVSPEDNIREAGAGIMYATMGPAQNDDMETGDASEAIQTEMIKHCLALLVKVADKGHNSLFHLYASDPDRQKDGPAHCYSSLFLIMSEYTCNERIGALVGEQIHAVCAVLDIICLAEISHDENKHGILNLLFSCLSHNKTALHAIAESEPLSKSLCFIRLTSDDFKHRPSRETSLLAIYVAILRVIARDSKSFLTRATDAMTFKTILDALTMRSDDVGMLPDVIELFTKRCEMDAQYRTLAASMLAGGGRLANGEPTACIHFLASTLVTDDDRMTFLKSGGWVLFVSACRRLMSHRPSNCHEMIGVSLGVALTLFGPLIGDTTSEKALETLKGLIARDNRLAFPVWLQFLFNVLSTRDVPAALIMNALTSFEHTMKVDGGSCASVVKLFSVAHRRSLRHSLLPEQIHLLNPIRVDDEDSSVDPSPQESPIAARESDDDDADIRFNLAGLDPGDKRAKTEGIYSDYCGMLYRILLSILQGGHPARNPMKKETIASLVDLVTILAVQTVRARTMEHLASFLGMLSQMSADRVCRPLLEQSNLLGHLVHECVREGGCWSDLPEGTIQRVCQDLVPLIATRGSRAVSDGVASTIASHLKTIGDAVTAMVQEEEGASPGLWTVKGTDRTLQSLLGTAEKILAVWTALLSSSNQQPELDAMPAVNAAISTLQTAVNNDKLSRFEPALTLAKILSAADRANTGG